MGTPDPNQLAAAIAAVRDVGGSIDRVSARLDDVKTDSEERDAALAEANKELAKRGRKLLWSIIGLTASLAIDLCLTSWLYSVSHHAEAASQRATAAAVAARRASASNRALCLSSNKARVQQIGIWSYALSLSGPPASPKARRVVAGFEAHLRHVYAPRDCDHLTVPKPASRGKRHG